MPKREKPALIVRKTKRGIVPVSAYDEERLSALTLDSELELKAMTKRSSPQLRLYWAILSRVVAAADVAPSASHLHELIKVELGYVTLVKLLDGSIASWPDSAALDAMEPPEFNQFFEAAMSLLAERCGFDPMQALAEAA